MTTEGPAGLQGLEGCGGTLGPLQDVARKLDCLLGLGQA